MGRAQLQVSSHDSALQDSGGALSLTSYMELPVEQYYELDPQMIRPLGGNRFALTVPRTEVRCACPQNSRVFSTVCPMPWGAWAMSTVLLSHPVRLQALQAVVWVQLLGVWVEPLVEIQVLPTQNKVTLQVRQACLDMQSGCITSRSDASLDLLARSA